MKKLVVLASLLMLTACSGVKRKYAISCINSEGAVSETKVEEGRSLKFEDKTNRACLIIFVD